MVMKKHPKISKASELEPHYQVVLSDTQDPYLGGVLLFSRDAVYLFYSPSLLG